MNLKYFDRTRIAGVQYGDSIFCIDELRPGKKLRLMRETNNPYDPDAVAIYCDQCKLGYIPRSENKIYSVFFDQGWLSLFEVYVERYDPDAHPESQILIKIYIRRNEPCEAEISLSGDSMAGTPGRDTAE